MQRKLTRAPADHAIFAWCDSTDLGGYQLLLARSIRIERADLIRALRHFWCVARDAVYLERDVALEKERQRQYSLGLTDDVADYDVDDESEETSDQFDLLWPASEGPPPPRLHERQRQAEFKSLNDILVQHVALPACLGLGYTNAASKASALMYSYALESADLPQLNRTNLSVHAMCTDMGPEMQLPNFSAEVSDTLPTWHPWHTSRPQLIPDDCDLPPQHTHDMLFPNAIAIPGICHTANNLLKDVDQKLHHWDWFYDRLKNTSAVLSRDQARRRVVVTCVHGRAAPHHASMWEQAPQSLYEPRWGQVVIYLRGALPMLQILQGCWDQSLYQGGGAGQGQDASAGVVFDAKLFSETLGSSKFFLYAHMVLNLHLLMSDMGGLLESCPCHSPLLQGKTQSQRAAALKADYAGDVNSCLLAGFRAPELASGLLQEKLADFQKHRRGLLHHMAVSSRAPVSEWIEVVGDYDIGTQFMTSGLEIKLSFWNKFPYVLAGLAHTLESVSRACAVRCIKLFDEQNIVPEAIDVHHPLTLRILCDHREDMDKFIRGAHRTDLGDAFLQELAIMRFWPVAERVMEATHKTAKKDAGLMRSNPSSYSLAIRARPLLQRACQYHMIDLLECIDTARKANRVCDLLGFQHHPQVQSLRSAGAHHTKMFTLLTKLLYRADTVDMFQDTDSLQKQNDTRKRKRNDAAARLMFQVGGVGGLCADRVLRVALLEHVRSVGMLNHGCVLELPAFPDASGLPTLHSVVTNIPESMRSAPTISAFISDFESEATDSQLPTSTSNTRFYRVLHMTPSRWKTVHIPCIHGGRVPESGFLLAPCHAIVLEDGGGEDGFHACFGHATSFIGLASTSIGCTSSLNTGMGSTTYT